MKKKRMNIIAIVIVIATLALTSFLPFASHFSLAEYSPQVWSFDGTNLFSNIGGAVGIGDTSPDTGTSTLKLDVEGPVGATEYCDEDGNNCTAAVDLNSDSTNIHDADNNTIVHTETNANEDIIRFSVGGTERWAMIGSRIEQRNTTDVAIGLDALSINTTGLVNVAVGNEALSSNTTGWVNVAVGNGALRDNSIGLGNTAVGNGALRSNQTGNGNTAVGNNALDDIGAANDNSAIGNNALDRLDTGDYNIAMGRDAGQLTSTLASYTDGAYNVYLGADTKAFAIGDQNEIVIGFDATGLGSNTVTLGNDAIVTTALKGNVGIGTTTPQGKLDISDTINIFDASSVETYAAIVDTVLDLPTSIEAEDFHAQKIKMEIPVTNSSDTPDAEVEVLSIDGIYSGSTPGTLEDLSGLDIDVASEGTGYVEDIYALDINARTRSTGDVRRLMGGMIQARANSSNTIETITGLNISAGPGTTNGQTAIVDDVIGLDVAADALQFGTGSSTVTNVYGIRFHNVFAAAGAITNAYGLYIDNVGTMGNISGDRFAIYQSNVDDPNYFAGKVGIGDTSPDTGTSTLKLDVEGPVGATEYCDENGNNCTAAAALGSDASNIHDADNNTIVHTETNANEDIIRFSTGGAERLRIEASGIHTDQWLDSPTNTALGIGTFGAGNLSHVAGDEGWHNTAIGRNALRSNTTGFTNTAQGENALYFNTDGDNNSAHGFNALFLNSTGGSNSAYGRSALYSNTSGTDNSALGNYALTSNSTGHDNSAQGALALQYSQTGGGNTAQGYAAGNGSVVNYTGSDFNTFLGYRAGYRVASDMDNNVFLGANAGYNQTIGSNNIAIGANIDLPVLTGSNQLNIANSIYSPDITTGYIGIGEQNPVTNLDINGGVAYAIQTVAANYVATVNDHMILCNATAGAVQVTLPDATTVNGLEMTVKKTDAVGANACTLVDAIGANIDGLAAQPIAVQFNSITVMSDGVQWWIK